MSYLLYSFAWRFIRLLPERSAYRLGDAVARYVIRRGGRRVARLRSNLAVVRPSLDESELDQLLDAAMRSNLRYWIDTFRFPSWSSDRIRETVLVENREVFDSEIARGKGLIVALPHAGNWDHAGAFFCAEGHPLVTVAEHLRPERLFRRFLAYREAMGMEVLDLDAKVMNTLEVRLREGRLIALVADRDLSSSGIEIDFFGRKAKFPAGPAKLALETGASLITAYISYTDEGIKVSFSKPIPTNGRSVVEIVQSIAANFQIGIERAPEDWHMLQRVFLEEEK
jgi:phosphatidylinositol dimannoside acyltransferase